MTHKTLLASAISLALLLPSAALAVPLTAWSAIGEDPGDWTEIGPTQFSIDGDVTLRFKSAAWDHVFGAAEPGNFGNRNILIDSSVDPVGFTTEIQQPATPYNFYFQNISGDLAGEFAISDGTVSAAGLDLAIFENMAMPGRYLLFLDDGGGLVGDDDSFTDMIVEAGRNAVPEPASLALLGAGLLGLPLLRRRRSRQP